MKEQRNRTNFIAWWLQKASCNQKLVLLNSNTTVVA